MQATEKKRVFHLAQNGSQRGPYSAEEVRAFLANGSVSWDCHGWCEGMVSWQRLSDIEEFRTGQAVPPPVPVPQVSAGQQRARSQWGLRALWLLPILAVAAGVSLFYRPLIQRYRILFPAPAGHVEDSQTPSQPKTTTESQAPDTQTKSVPGSTKSVTAPAVEEPPSSQITNPNLVSICPACKAFVDAFEQYTKSELELDVKAAAARKGHWVQGFMVGLQGSENGMELYEFAPNMWAPQVRALLLTKETRYQTKGMFRIFAERLTGNIPIQLKPEAGGFNAEWPMYIEITRAEREEMQKQRSDLKSSREKQRSQFEDAIRASSEDPMAVNNFWKTKNTVAAATAERRKVDIERQSIASVKPAPGGTLQITFVRERTGGKRLLAAVAEYKATGEPTVLSTTLAKISAWPDNKDSDALYAFLKEHPAKEIPAKRRKPR